LKLKRQYNKNVGRLLSVKLADGIVKEGKLLSLTDNEITIEENVKEKGKKAYLAETTISFDQIIETKVLISFK
jgi:ribosome maturation factor RimP